MKQLRFTRTIFLMLISLVIVCFIISCDKDKNTFNIVGTWNIDKVITDDDVSNNTGTITFFSDGNGTRHSYVTDESVSFTWLIDGDYLIIDHSRREEFRFIDRKENSMVIERTYGGDNQIVHKSRI